MSSVDRFEIRRLMRGHLLELSEVSNDIVAWENRIYDPSDMDLWIAEHWQPAETRRAANGMYMTDGAMAYRLYSKVGSGTSGQESLAAKIESKFGAPLALQSQDMDIIVMRAESGQGFRDGETYYVVPVQITIKAYQFIII